MDKNLQTLSAYNDFPEVLTQKYNKMGARKDCINRAFSFFEHKNNLKVLEIGCGNGRDAEEILNLTKNYTGIDYSEGMLNIAKKNLPDANFIKADIRDYQTDERFDIIFSFASLLHIEKIQLQIILSKISNLLNKEGILILSLKYSEEYMEEIVNDEVGARFFYLYNPEIIKEISKNVLDIVSYEIKEINKRKWFEVILK